jgi:hypothetical protein
MAVWFSELPTITQVAMVLGLTACVCTIAYFTLR